MAAPSDANVMSQDPPPTCCSVLAFFLKCLSRTRDVSDMRGPLKKVNSKQLKQCFLLRSRWLLWIWESSEKPLKDPSAVDRLNPIGGMPSWNAKWPLSRVKTAVHVLVLEGVCWCSLQAERSKFMTSRRDSWFSWRSRQYEIKWNKILI